MLEGENIVCIAPNTWDGVWWRRQQLMSRFSKKNNVLYVEPAKFILFTLFSRKGWAALFRGQFYLRKESDNLHLLSQYLVLPFETALLKKRISLVKKVNDWVNIWVLKRTLRHLRLNKPILWIYYTPRSEYFIGRCGERLVICDVFDRYSAYPYFADHPWLKEFTDQNEARQLARADFVIACSEPLVDHCQNFNRRVHLVTNGTDTLLTDRPTSIPEDVRDIPHPVLGYVGAISDKVDLQLLNSLADAHPEWSILMVGHLDGDQVQSTSFQEKSNVYFVGRKERSELPDYYGVIDVGLMPYKLTEHTEHIFPLKMLEYMYFKKPTVSTDIPAARQFSDVISIAGNGVQFEENVTKLLNEDNSQRLQSGVETALLNSWDFRVEEISEIIADYLQAEEK